VVELLVDLVLTAGVLDVILLRSLVPARVQLVDLAGDELHFLDVKGLVDFAETPFTQELDGLVALFENRPGGLLTSGLTEPATSTGLDMLAKRRITFPPHVFASTPL